MTPNADTVSREEWASRMRQLPLDEQAAMLAAAARLLKNPNEISGPLESELYAPAEQTTRSIADALES